MAYNLLACCISDPAIWPLGGTRHGVSAEQKALLNVLTSNQRLFCVVGELVSPVFFPPREQITKALLFRDAIYFPPAQILCRPPPDFLARTKGERYLPPPQPDHLAGTDRRAGARADSVIFGNLRPSQAVPGEARAGEVIRYGSEAEVHKRVCVCLCVKRRAH